MLQIPHSLDQSGSAQAEAAFRALYAREARIKSLKFDFVTYTNGRATSSRSFEMKRPNFERSVFHWKQGYSVLDVDGKNSWYYMAPLNTYFKDRALPDRLESAEFAFSQFDFPDRTFLKCLSVGREVVSKQPVTAITCAFPESKKRIIIYVGEKSELPVGYRFGADAKRNTIHLYKNMKVDIPIADSEFAFIPPKGARWVKKNSQLNWFEQVASFFGF